MNSSLYNVISENQLTEVLSHYNTEYVMSVIDMSMATRFNPNAVMRQPNVVAAWEQHFKQMLITFQDLPDSRSRIENVRIQTYKEIIARICQEFNLNFTIDDSIDWYSAAFYLYDFFVANFNTNLVVFFSNYIYKERSELYEAMNLATMRKSKDSSTIYGKKIFKDIRLALISAYIDSVVRHIEGFDIKLYNIFNTVYHQKELVYFMTNIVSDKGDFFSAFYRQVLNSPIRPILLTDIRMSIQNVAMEFEGPVGIKSNEDDDKGE